MSSPKRRRTTRARSKSPVFDSGSEDGDHVAAKTAYDIASPTSTRQLSVPHLTTLCAKAFVSALPDLLQTGGDQEWEVISKWLAQLPPATLRRVFVMIQSLQPVLFEARFGRDTVIRNLVKDPSAVILDSSLTPNNMRALLANASTSLHHLELTGFGEVKDALFASVVSTQPSLFVLNLRGCSNVGIKTMAAVAQTCKQLQVANLNYTAVSPVHLAPLLMRCQRLEVLKLAGISSWTDNNFAKLIPAPFNSELSHLRTLKLRQTSLSEVSLNKILPLCPNLRRLDISFTQCKHAPSIEAVSSDLAKLCITSTRIPPREVIDLLGVLPRLRVLHLGALGGGSGSSAMITNSSAMTMSDRVLDDITNTLKQCEELEYVNFVANSKLGLTKRDRALSNFVCLVGRRCKHLNLANISNLRSIDLQGLVPSEGSVPSPVVDLNLDNTAVDDEASSFIASCPSLRKLSVAGTRFSTEGLFTLIDECVELAEIDANRCRGVKITDRRRLFQARMNEA